MPVATSPSSEPIISSLESHASLGVLMSDQGPLPLKSVSIDAHLDQLFAGVKVRQGYVNTHRDTIEATYIFPLPDRAAVTRFQAKLGDRLIEGILKERGAARQEYAEAIQLGHRAAIAEEERPNVFTMRVGNILPGESAEIELTLCMPLAYEEGEATLRFPLVVAPRYIPGTPLEDAVGLGTSPDTDAVPDASRITPPVLLPGYPYPVQLDINVALASEIGEPKVNMPVKAVEKLKTHTRWQVQPGQKLDRDFLFRFTIASSTIVSQAIIAPDHDNPKEGTLCLTIVPPKPSAKASKPKPRRLVFVLDRSGSMSGWKMIAARRSLGRMIDTLSVQDHFATIAFDDSIETLPPDLCDDRVPAKWYSGTDTHRYRAIESLAKIEARGGTEMEAPLLKAVSLLNNEHHAEEDRILVLITDGQVGNEDQILKKLSGQVAGIRLFNLGIDQAVNDGFLNRLAQLAGGTTEYVDSEARLDEVMQRIHRRISAPVLRNLRWDLEGIKLELCCTVPEKVTDLFPEAPVVIMSRCILPASGQVILQATDDTDKPWKQTLTPQFAPSPVLVSCWARAKVRAMEDELTAHGPRGFNTEAMIVRHSLKYGVLSRFTAYLAVDRSATIGSDSKPREIVQAVEMPAGWAQPGAVPQFNTLRKSMPACRMAHYEAAEMVLHEEAPVRASYHNGVFDREPSPRVRKLEDLNYSLAQYHRMSGPASNVDERRFKDRAREMVCEFDSQLAIDRDQAVGKLLLDLRKLRDDMQIVGIDSSVIKQFTVLLEQLKKLQEPGSKVKPWKEDALNPLRNFAGMPLMPSKGKRWLSFWK